MNRGMIAGFATIAATGADVDGGSAAVVFQKTNTRSRR
jgi:hypothetical protein